MNEQAVSEFPDRYIAAVFEKDVDALMGLYDDDIRIFDLWGVWVYDSPAEWRQSVTDWFASVSEQQRVGVSFDDVHISATEDLATLLAVITYSEVGPDGATQESMQNRLTWILKRRGDVWKIVHEHTSAPVDFETAKVDLQRY